MPTAGSTDLILLKDYLRTGIRENAKGRLALEASLPALKTDG